ncbi:TPA: FG-GAP-like repeat-containing protein [Vibrio vulnificus]
MDLRQVRKLSSLLIACVVSGYSDISFASFGTSLQLEKTSNGVENTGVASVGINGNAKYHYSIPLPSGINGFTPQLGISYNSSLGKGSLGYGWALSGPQSISRCQSSYFVDGEPGSITGDQSDKLCLNGMRLINVDGEYGAAETEYRTLSDTYKKVILHKGIQASDSWFEVWDSDGIRSEYRQSVNLESGVPIFWYQTLMADLSGNLINYHYEKKSSGTNKALHLSTVTYNGFSVRIDYETANRKRSYFRAGSEFSDTLKIKTINVLVADSETPVLTVSAHYDLEDTNQDLLSKVTLSRYSSPEIVAFTIDWNDEGVEDFTDYSQVFDGDFSEHRYSYRTFADVDGDGLPDYVGFAANGVYVAFADGAGSYSSPSLLSREFAEVNLVPREEESEHRGGRRERSSIGLRIAGYSEHEGLSSKRPEPDPNREWNALLHPRLLSDVNGDGKADIVGFGNSGVSVALSEGRTFKKSEQWINSFGYVAGGWASNNKRVLADVNGDGLNDIIGFANSGVYVSLSDGSRFMAPTMWSSFFGARQVDEVGTGDFNGDGLADILAFSKSGTSVALSTGASFTNNELWSTAFATQNRHMVYHVRDLVDINDDGLTDVIGFADAGAYVALSTGKSLEASSLWKNQFGFKAGGWRVGEHPRLLVDVNYDGIRDIIGFANDRVVVAQGTGGGFLDHVGSLRAFGTRAGGWSAADVRTSVDLNGDGKMDLVGVNGSGIHTAFSRISTPLVNTITSNLGNVSRFDYGTLSDTRVYRRGPDAQYPQQNVTSGIVVKSLSVSDGIGGYNELAYKYEGKKVHLMGAHNLGFEKVHQWNKTTHQIESHTYHQDVENTLLYSALKEKVVCQLTSYNEFSFDSCSVDSANKLTKLTNHWHTEKAIGNGRPTAGKRVAPSYKSPFEPRQRFKQQLIKSVTKNWGLDGTFLQTVTIDKAYDKQFGYIKSETTTTVDHIHNQTTTTSVVNEYKQPNHDKWLVRLLEKNTIAVSQSNTAAGAKLNTQTKTYDYEYDNNGLLVKEIKQKGTELESVIEYGNFYRGLPQIITERWSAVLSKNIVGKTGSPQNFRQTFKSYDEYGYLKRETNALGYTKTYTFNPVLGILVHMQDERANVTSYDYDQWGRLIGSREPTGAWSTILYELSAEEGSVYSKTVRSSNAPEQKTWYDARHREVKSMTRVLGGKPYAFTTTRYNALGQVSSSGVPSPSEVPEATTDYQYDALGRVTHIKKPDGSSSRYSYSGFTTEMTNSRGYTTSTTFDALGQKVEVKDADNNSVQYQYDAWGNLVQTEDPRGNRIEVGYDILGNRTRLKDPDLGVVNYAPNGLGLVYKTEKNQDVVVNEYFDLLGRIVKRESSKANYKESVQSWKYQARGGLLSEVSQAGNVENYEYFNNGLLQHKYITILGQSYHQEYEYDLTGRLEFLHYGNGVVTEQAYHESNRLSKVYLYKKGLTGARDLVWSAKEMDSFGNMTDLQFGNGLSSVYQYQADTGYIDRTQLFKGNNVVKENQYRFDSVGNLTFRSELDSQLLKTKVKTDEKLLESGREWGVRVSYAHYDYQMELQESLSYDALNRLIQVDTSRSAVILSSRTESKEVGLKGYMSFENCLKPITIQPDPLEPITHVNQVKPSDLLANPRALGPVSLLRPEYELEVKLENNFCSPSIGRSPFADDKALSSVVMAYDALGNIEYKQDVGRYTYGALRAGSSERLPHAVSQVVSSNGQVQQFTYDVHGNMLSGAGRSIRYNANHKPISIKKGNATTEFEYGVHGQRYLRKDTTERGITTTRYLDSTEVITQPNGQTTFRYYLGDKAIYEYTVGDVKLSGIKYLHKDHLGSVIAISNELGDIEQRFSYDAWGKRRGTHWQPQLEQTSSIVGRLGFTGHEMLDDVGLIHMNGRVYDPTLARFLSADPFIQDKWFATQAFNRYSYVQNNPLSYTDPTGKFVLQVIGAALTAYDVYKAYQEDGIAGAVKALIEEGITNVATGGLARVAKVGKTVVQKVAKAVEDSSKSLPNNQLQLAAASDKAPSFNHIDDAKTKDVPLSSQQAGATDSADAPKSRDYDRPEIETKSGTSVKQKNATDEWDEFLGSDQTNIDPRDGLPDPDRIWSADGKRSIRFGEHEMNSKPNKLHYHQETWHDDKVENVLQRIPK